LPSEVSTNLAASSRRSVLRTVEELLDDDVLGLVDDHAPGGVAIGLEARGLLDFPSQRTRGAPSACAASFRFP
jgi:hypothetical protein